MANNSSVLYNTSVVAVLDSITTPGLTNNASNDQSSSHVLAYILVPLGSLVLVAIIAFVVMMIFRKNRLDRLRHHLMPLYSFDPQEEDWESELLDDRGRRISYRDGTTSPNTPKLKFNT